MGRRKKNNKNRNKADKRARAPGKKADPQLDLQEEEARILAVIRTQTGTSFTQDIELKEPRSPLPGSTWVLGRGGQGLIFEGETRDDSEGGTARVAIKVAENRPQWKTLCSEYNTMRSFLDAPHTSRLLPSLGMYLLTPPAHTDNAVEEQPLALMVVPLKAQSLFDWRKRTPDETFRNGKNMSPLTLELARNMLRCIRQLHKRELIHRDISLGNFLVDFPTTTHGSFLLRDIVLTDFGLTKTIRSEMDNRKWKWGGEGEGTDMFAPVSAYLPHGTFYRDDLESLGFVLLAVTYGLGVLPWWNAKPNNNELRRQKEQFLQDLTSMDHIDDKFKEFFNKVHALPLETVPRYKPLLSVFGPNTKDTFVQNTRGGERDQPRLPNSVAQKQRREHRTALTTPLWEMDFTQDEVVNLLERNGDLRLVERGFPGATPLILDALARNDIDTFNDLDILYFSCKRNKERILHRIWDMVVNHATAMNLAPTLTEQDVDATKGDVRVFTQAFHLRCLLLNS